MPGITLTPVTVIIITEPMTTGVLTLIETVCARILRGLLPETLTLAGGTAGCKVRAGMARRIREKDKMSYI